MKNNRLVGLDLLRFFCAVSVMAFHLAYLTSWPTITVSKSILQGIATYPDLAPYTWWGWVSVEIFFVISGFVISLSAENATPLHFLRSRFLRLAPALWICTTITFGVAAAVQWLPINDLVRMYVHSMLIDPRGGWFAGVYWTLPIEVVFYALTWFLLVAARLRWLMPVMAVLATVSSFVWLLRLGHAIGLGTPEIPVTTTSKMFVDYWIFFAIGVAIQSKSEWRLPLIVVLSALSIVPVVVLSGGYIYPLATLLTKAAAPAVYLAGVVVVFMVHSGRNFDRWLPRWGLQLASLAGLATYPLYLLHEIAGPVCMRIMISAGMNRFAALTLGMAAMIGLAAFVTVVLEPRLRGLLGRALPGQARSVVAPA